MIIFKGTIHFKHRYHWWLSDVRFMCHFLWICRYRDIFWVNTIRKSSLFSSRFNFQSNKSIKPDFFCLDKFILSINNSPNYNSLSMSIASDANVCRTLKSDLNEVLFVLELGELLSINNKITTIWNLKKNYTNKKYLNNNYFLFYFVVLSEWKWTQPLF